MASESGQPDDVLRLAVSDFWRSFDPGTRNFLFATLRERWRLELDERAGLLAYGPFGQSHAASRVTKVYCSGEPFAYPSRLGRDFSLSWHLRDDERHVRVVNGAWEPLANPAEFAAIPPRSFDDWASRPDFCNFVFANAGPPERREFLEALSRRRFVHSPGEVGTNTEGIPKGRRTPDWWLRKLPYLRRFRFTIAFENASLPGYTSEKCVDALLGGTVPIYWGNSEIAIDVDPGSFVDARDFASWDELADHVIQLDDDRELARPLFENEQPLRFDVDQIRAAILGLVERARDDRGPSRRALRVSRPALYGTARSLRALRL
ncbi:MAG TPA: glycosyltransferase family 10 [Gaiellaceae bacterium]|nr:glycosyltransferase family 10 [Gaiellaceae bacterium]